MKLIISFILGFILAIAIIGIYTYFLWLKIDTILSSINRPVSCDSLPYWVQEKLEQTYENITSFKCTTNP